MTGDTVVVTSQDGVTVVEVQTPGPQGAPGSQGLQGPAGTTGPAGPRGVAGPTGAGVPNGGTADQVLSKIDSTNQNTMWVTLTKASVGLGNVDNTSDANQPVSTLVQAALDGKLSLTGGTLTGPLAISGVSAGQGLVITGTGDRARLTLAGPSNSSWIQTSFNGQSLDVNINGNANAAVRVNSTDLRLYSDPANSTTTIRQPLTIQLTGRYWNGTASIDANASIKNVLEDTAGANRLAFFLGATEQMSIKTDGTVTIPQGIVATNFAGSHQFTNTKISTGSGDALQIIGTGTNNTIARWYDDGAERGAIFSLNSSAVMTYRSQGDIQLQAMASTTSRYISFNASGFYSTSAIDLGTTSNPWVNGYITRTYFNTTAFIDGATAGQLALTGIAKLNNSTAPGTNPSGGGFLYVEAGALKFRGSSGTVTVLGNA